MPYNHDFSGLENVRQVEISPSGWISPIQIEYGVGFHGAIPSYFWRVKGTTHTFIIAISRMNFLSSGNYNEHFKEVLEKFRGDYKEWAGEGFNTEWGVEYKKQFSRFISL